MNMTWAQLLEQLNALPVEQLNEDVLVEQSDGEIRAAERLQIQTGDKSIYGRSYIAL